jgi:hypothetical protein
LSCRKREDVLYQLKITLTPPPDKIVENPWIMVDSEGEEVKPPLPCLFDSHIFYILRMRTLKMAGGF